MTSVVIILPYFGSFPNYFNFWLQSCKNNSTIDWIIFTDNDISTVADSRNILYVNISFEEFCRKFEDYLDYKVALDKPYKLCDFKILYGFVLSDYVKNYDFWGYCDCDMIFGDIRKFATEEILSKCDKFLGHGHLSLQRTNDPEYPGVIEKTLSKGRYDCKYVFTHRENFSLDEYDHLGIPYTYLILKNTRFYTGYASNNTIYQKTNVLYPAYTEKYHSTEKINNDRIYDDIYPEISHFRDLKDTKKGKRIILYSYNKGKLCRVISEKGKITYEETLYLHMMKRRMLICIDNLNQYYIIPNKFVAYNDQPSLKYFRKYGRRKIIDLRSLKNDVTLIRSFLKIGTRIRSFRNRISNL